MSRGPTAISREEEKEEKEDVKEVPDTLLLSISPDLVSFLSHNICGPCQFLDGPSYDRERVGQNYGINFRQHFLP